MEIGIPELMIIFFIAVLFFGPGRLSRLGGELGTAIRSLREGLGGDDEDEDGQG